MLLCCCSPDADNAAETLSTLRFGSRAKGLTCRLQVSVCSMQHVCACVCVGRCAHGPAERRCPAAPCNMSCGVCVYVCVRCVWLTSQVNQRLSAERLQELLNTERRLRAALEKEVETLRQTLSHKGKQRYHTRSYLHR